MPKIQERAIGIIITLLLCCSGCARPEIGDTLYPKPEESLSLSNYEPTAVPDESHKAEGLDNNGESGMATTDESGEIGDTPVERLDERELIVPSDVIHRLQDTRYDYKITMQTLQYEDKVSVEYPCISEMDNAALQKHINDLLLESAKHLYTEDPSVTMHLQCEIQLANSKILSIVIQGDYEYAQVNEERITWYVEQETLYSVNINMETGEYLRLKDILSIDQEFIDILLDIYSDEYSIMYPYGGLKTYLEEDKDKLLEWFENMDDRSYPGLYYSYYTSSTIGIIWDIPKYMGLIARTEIPVVGEEILVE